MKYFLYSGLMLLLFSLATPSAYADVHRLALKQHTPYTYISQEGYIIETIQCDETPSSFQTVVIVYPKEFYSNKHLLIFTESKKNGICEIRSVKKGPTFPTIALE